MTRKEEIRNAIDAIFPILPPNNGRTYEQALMATGFEAGAGWADKHPVNAWHDASEEPQDKNERILSYSEYFDCFFLDFPNYLMIPIFFKSEITCSVNASAPILFKWSPSQKNS